jgi:hypothetical protein
MDYYIVSKNSLTSIADAIRSKIKQNKSLNYPQDFINEINKIIIATENIWDGVYEITPSLVSQILET